MPGCWLWWSPAGARGLPFLHRLCCLSCTAPLLPPLPTAQCPTGPMSLSLAQCLLTSSPPANDPPPGRLCPARLCRTFTPARSPANDPLMLDLCLLARPCATCTPARWPTWI